MYRMLSDEVKWAIDDVCVIVICIEPFPDLDPQNEPYTFSHLLFISRTYHLTPDEESALINSAPPTTSSSPKKSKRSKAPPAQEFIMEPPQDGIRPFHPEDEYIKQVRFCSWE